MLPHTTQTHYITGMTALNIPSPTKKSGDWHFHESFYGRNGKKPKIFIAGDGETLNTNPALSNFGIYECSDVLRTSGLNIPANDKVYAADHCRAILDMIYRLVKNHHYPHHIDIDEWIDDPDEKARLINAAQRLKFFLEQDQWKMLQDWLSKQI